MAVIPLLTELSVALRLISDAQLARRIFQQRVELETDVAVVAECVAVHGGEDTLGVAHELVRHGPRDGLVVEALFEEFLQIIVEAAGLDQVGDDDRV